MRRFRGSRSGGDESAPDIQRPGAKLNNQGAAIPSGLLAVRIHRETRLAHKRFRSAVA